MALFLRFFFFVVFLIDYLFFEREIKRVGHRHHQLHPPPFRVCFSVFSFYKFAYLRIFFLGGGYFFRTGFEYTIEMRWGLTALRSNFSDPTPPACASPPRRRRRPTTTARSSRGSWTGSWTATTTGSGRGSEVCPEARLLHFCLFVCLSLFIYAWEFFFGSEGAAKTPNKFSLESFSIQNLRNCRFQRTDVLMRFATEILGG